MENNVRPVILSGVTPSGILTIGHLTGAISNWVKLQETHECFFMIADMHAITVRQNAAELRKRTLDTAAIYLAAGIDPEKSTLFIQSHVPEHAQLTWILNTFTGMGELSRMTQYKDKSAQNSENNNAGLFDYPVLMASDILLYQADLVPVGEDQKQHLELTRNLAQRFNHHYSDTFTTPEPFIPEIGARIMSLQEPEKKMSKSDENQNSVIFITDSDAEIRNKIKRAVTDSDSKVVYSENKRGVSNLMTLYHIATGKSFKEIESEFDGKGYGDFKETVGEAVARYIKPIRTKYEEYIDNKSLLADILTKGADNARKHAFKTLRKVYKKVGFITF